MNSELISKIATASALIGMLPEMPGYNGSVLMIDDEEAARISRELDEVVAALSQQEAEPVAWADSNDLSEEHGSFVVAQYKHITDMTLDGTIVRFNVPLYRHPAPAVSRECSHNWVDATKEAVSGVKICRNCLSMRITDKTRPPPQAVIDLLDRISDLERRNGELEKALDWVLADYEGVCRHEYPPSANWKRRMVVARAALKFQPITRAKEQK